MTLQNNVLDLQNLSSDRLANLWCWYEAIANNAKCAIAYLIQAQIF
jgi:hypothetical protein